MYYNIYKKLLGYLKPYITRFILALICMALVAGLTALSRWLIKPLLDEGFIGKNLDTLYTIVIALPILFILKGIFWYGQTYFMNYIGNNVVRRIREQLFNHLQMLSMDYYHKSSTGKIMAIFTDYIYYLRYAITEVPLKLICDGLTFIALLGLLFYLNWKLSLISLAVLPFAIVAITGFARRIRSLAKSTQKQIGSLYSNLQEVITGAMVVKAFGQEKNEIRRFNSLNTNIHTLFMRLAKTGAISSPTMEVLGTLGTVLIFYLGGREVIEGKWSTGSFFAFAACILSFYEPLRGLAGLNSILQQGIVAAKNIFSALEEKITIKEPENPKEIHEIKDNIKFENVSFTYPGTNELVLDDINLRINPKETIAIVGPSGAGKTSLVHLLLRFYEPNRGKILIDGHDIKELSLKSLRRIFAIVPQEVFLFNETIRYNVAYGANNATEEEIISACKASNAHDFIMNLPSGYDTVVGERGVKLSSGEKQRIAIARALIRKPSVLIFDEATSAIDSESERLIQESIRNLREKLCIIIIAHRFFTTKIAQRVIVLKDGKIAEMGTHDELFEKDGIYRKLKELQLI